MNPIQKYRRVNRRSGDLPEVRILKSNVPIAKGYWLNLSEGGMLMSLPSFAGQLPSTFEISFTLPGSKRAVRLFVRLAWFKSASHSSVAGIEFVELDTVQRNLLSKTIFVMRSQAAAMRLDVNTSQLFWLGSIALLAFLALRKMIY